MVEQRLHMCTTCNLLMTTIVFKSGTGFVTSSNSLHIQLSNFLLVTTTAPATTVVATATVIPTTTEQTCIENGTVRNVRCFTRIFFENHTFENHIYPCALITRMKTIFRIFCFLRSARRGLGDCVKHVLVMNQTAFSA